MARRRTVLRTALAATTLGIAGCNALTLGREDDEDVVEEETDTDDETESDENEDHESVGEQRGERVMKQLQVLQARGVKTAADGAREVGGVMLIATKAPGAEDIDLTGMTFQWVDDTGAYDVVHEAVYDERADGAFAHEALTDEDDSLSGEATPTITSSDDRVMIVIDIGAAEPADGNQIAGAYDTSGRAPATIREGKGGLAEGETASIRITTASGTASTVQLVVPESLSGTTAVRL
ncbi:hypothetical protein ACFR9U_07880 [Halorientalis brevis]|uniref:Flagellin n=1 Tax=Halorientalis brevis TaxID=1126241 RepID=A0ABD6CBU5_9EURY|nr:hypothetical protein [Halorientalis brevis]